MQNVELLNNMQPGDLFLMCADAKSSEWLARLQKAIYKNARSSHVMISLGDGAFVHATTEEGVVFTSYPSINEKLKDGWRVIRRTVLSQEDFDSLQKSAMFYAGQAYNYKFYLKGNDSSSFCSELAAKIYSLANIDLVPERDPSRITPAHIDEIADKSSLWQDVTEIYVNGFADIDKDQGTYAIAHLCFFSLINKRQRMLKLTDQLFEMIDTGAKGDEKLTKLRDEFFRMEAEFRKKKNISFWNENKYPATEKNDK